MKLYIFRHGETFANVDKLVSDGYSSIVQLTPLGKEQALELGKKLSPKKLPLIYSSPYDRARTTAEYVASFNQTPIEIINDLREFSFGITEGWTEEKTYKKYNFEFKSVLDVSDENTYNISLPEGESKQEALNRFLQALTFIKNNCPYEQVGVATHGHIMSLYYYHLYKQVHGFKNCEVLEVEI